MLHTEWRRHSVGEAPSLASSSYIPEEGNQLSHTFQATAQFFEKRTRAITLSFDLLEANIRLSQLMFKGKPGYGCVQSGFSLEVGDGKRGHTPGKLQFRQVLGRLRRPALTDNLLQCASAHDAAQYAAGDVVRSAELRKPRSPPNLPEGRSVRQNCRKPTSGWDGLRPRFALLSWPPSSQSDTSIPASRDLGRSSPGKCREASRANNSGGRGEAGGPVVVRGLVVVHGVVVDPIVGVLRAVEQRSAGGPPLHSIPASPAHPAHAS